MILLMMKMNSYAIKNENNKCKQICPSNLGLPVHADDDNRDQKNAGGGPNDAYVIQSVPSDHSPVLLHKQRKISVLPTCIGIEEISLSCSTRPKDQNTFDLSLTLFGIHKSIPIKIHKGIIFHRYYNVKTSVSQLPKSRVSDPVRSTLTDVERSGSETLDFGRCP